MVLVKSIYRRSRPFRTPHPVSYNGLPVGREKHEKMGPGIDQP